MFYCENVGDYVFKEGEKASCYFIIEKGECEILIGGSVRRVLKTKDAFGGNLLYIYLLILILKII